MLYDVGNMMQVALFGHFECVEYDSCSCGGRLLSARRLNLSGI